MITASSKHSFLNIHQPVHVFFLFFSLLIKTYFTMSSFNSTNTIVYHNNIRFFWPFLNAIHHLSILAIFHPFNCHMWYHCCKLLSWLRNNILDSVSTILPLLFKVLFKPCFFLMVNATSTFCQWISRVLSVTFCMTTHPSCICEKFTFQFVLAFISITFPIQTLLDKKCWS